jgi:HEPN domain-containing protein
LASPSRCNHSEHLADVKVQWDRHFGLAEGFLEGASYYLTSGSASLAVFMLHQATEQTCIALIKTCLGYRPTTHNLGRLLALTENFSEYPSFIFPQVSREETDLFNTLVRAYSDVRYTKHFEIPIEKAEILRQRLKDLQEIAVRLYKEKIQRITADQQQSSFIQTIYSPK